ncbi:MULTISPECIES: hypothetical protein [Methylomonas]|uniref:SPOR domain-containing protein n=2 Tax=Methylomonas TaxID=416 RepID=A0A140E3F2_9GAMM|nr:MULTISPECIES: hypothetical protein [Methylomonas]AMK74926.1 hypothetical protein JT25_000235 [Methylomonas denitrificans]OAI05790.1 hypothetical protein A1342_03270 [Methylomonas methanica]TCV81003.1 hypothetical protein EDE11_11752 [Methylomonas methanica]
MKALFFLLCLLNVLFFFSELHLGALTPAVEPPSNAPTLLLISERQTARRGAQISAYLDSAAAELQAKQISDVLQRLNPPQVALIFKTSAHTPKPAVSGRQQTSINRCYEAGPFNDQDALRRWANTERLNAFKPVYKPIIAASDFQVYYPAGKDAEQTRINKLMLKAKGFTDVWPITDGEIKGAISLGVFNDRQRATLYKTQLAEQGVKAEIRQRNKTRDELFIRFAAAQAASKNIAYTRVPDTDCGNALK